MTVALDLAGLSAELGAFSSHLFRLETLPRYAVMSDGDDYLRYARGEAEPDWGRKQPWLDRLRADRDAGKTRYRVRVFSEELTDYERYACTWGYALNGPAGEDIRVLRRGEHNIPAWLIKQDFWVVDDEKVVTMHYDSEFRFEDAAVLSWQNLPDFINQRDQLWSAAEPFEQWWSRHPELQARVAA